MGFLSKILNRLNILIVNYQDEETCSLYFTTARLKAGSGVSDPSRNVASTGEIARELKASPTEVLITGYGVICKDAAAIPDIVQKVKSREKEFVWSETDDRISFVRREQVQKILTDLEGLKTKLVAVTCTTRAGIPDEDLVNKTAEAYFSGLDLKSVVSVSAKGSALSVCLVNKFKFYVLGLLLVMAAANAMLKPAARLEYENAKRELTLLKDKYGETSAISRKKAEALKTFNRRIPLPVSLICDRIAMTLPANMALTDVALCPLVRKIERDKKPEFRDNLLRITGHTKESPDVLTYVTALKKLAISDNVSLSGMEYDRENKLYIFTIDVGL